MIKLDYINFPKIIGLINIIDQGIDLDPILSNINILKYCKNILQ